MPDAEQLIGVIEDVNDTYIITSKYLENPVGKKSSSWGKKD